MPALVAVKFLVPVCLALPCPVAETKPAPFRPGPRCRDRHLRSGTNGAADGAGHTRHAKRHRDCHGQRTPAKALRPPITRRSSDTRVIISACRTQKSARITRVSSVIRPEGLGDLRSPCRIGAHAVSQDREREAVHTGLVMHGSPPDRPRRLQHVLADTGALVWDGACSITPVGGRHPLGGAPVVVGHRPRRRSDERRGGGGAQFAGTAAVGAAVKRGCSSPGYAGLRPPGAARLRCPGERNGACRWLRPVRESSDAPVRAVRMSRGRGRRGRQGRGTAGCRTRWPGSRIWR